MRDWVHMAHDTYSQTYIVFLNKSEPKCGSSFICAFAKNKFNSIFFTLFSHLTE